jgi:hypothetical protein
MKAEAATHPTKKPLLLSEKPVVGELKGYVDNNNALLPRLTSIIEYVTNSGTYH